MHPVPGVAAVSLLARLKLWLLRQKCKLYVGICPLCAPERKGSSS